MADDEEFAGGVDVDRIWRALGPWGRYQWKQLLIYMFINVSWAIHIFSIVFIGYRPDLTCRDRDINHTGVWNTSQTWTEIGKCSITTYLNTSGEVTKSDSSCDTGWEYSIPSDSSFVTEWSLVCENEALAEVSQSLMTAGMMIGSFVCPPLSDRFGRKPVVVVTQVVLFLSALITSFSVDIYMFSGLRFVTGLVMNGAMSAAILSLETFPKEYRCYTEVFAVGTWTAGTCVMAPIAYALRHAPWRHVQLVYALFGAWALIMWWIYDESLRWLLANGHTDKAREVIQRACKWNKVEYGRVLEAAGLVDRRSGLELLAQGKEIDPAEVEKLLSVENGHVTEKKTEERGIDHYTVVDIFKHVILIRVSLIVWFIWFADSLIYFGLFMLSSKLYGDRYINFFLSALCELPAAIIDLFALNMLGRKLTIMMCHVMAALGLIVATIFTYTADGDSGMLTAVLVFTLFGKVGISGAFSSSYVATPELYPTNLRNAALGIGAFIGKVGMLVAPFLRNISNVAPWLPGAIFSCLCVIVVLLVPILPETNDVVLPDTIEELATIGSYNKAHYSLKFRIQKWTGLKSKPTP